jgi:hypothetical protein
MHSSPRARAALLALAVVASTVFASAAPTGCPDQCDTLSPSPTMRSVVRLAGGCAVRIIWTFHRSCTVGIDLTVLSVEPLTDACGGLSIARLLNEATDSLIASRETPFFTMAAPRDTCISIGRVLRAACWRDTIRCGDTLVVPCDTISCCESSVMLCTDAVFRRSIRRVRDVLRVPCDPRTGCPSICGEDGDSITPGSSDPTFGVAWPWRDPRPVRQPARDVHDPQAALAGLAPVRTQSAPSGSRRHRR